MAKKYRQKSVMLGNRALLNAISTYMKMLYDSVPETVEFNKNPHIFISGRSTISERSVLLLGIYSVSKESMGRLLVSIDPKPSNEALFVFAWSLNFIGIGQPASQYFTMDECQLLTNADQKILEKLINEYVEEL